WKLANIVPILKKCPASNVQNYRPISLLSNIGKIFERCVFNRVINHISNQLHNFQHGFLKGKSCTTHLLQVIDEIGRSLDCAEQTDIIYLDFAKAFDKVNHSLLLDKISGFGIDGNLLKWFGNYLSDRRQQVTIPGSTSGVLPVLSGVPQGSILGPLLFLMFINDLPDSVMENSDAKMVLFADDSKIYKTIRTTSDCMDLQTSIDRTSIWSCENKMLLNSKKCTIVSVNRKTQPTTFSYSLGRLPLGKTNCEKDLGVLIKSDLKWDAHVLSISKRANNALGYIRRGTTGFNDVDTRKVLYMALVRNHLVHASQVWAPQSVHLIKQLESLQRRATKYILCLPYDTTITYKDRLLKLDLLPMSYWHEYLDVLYLYKLASGMLSLKLHDFLKVKQPLRVTRRSNPSSGLMFDIPKSRRTIIQYNVSTFSQLFRDRYASVFLEKPIKEYRLLVERIKSAIPCFNQLHDDEIRIAYKDVHSGCFINIHANVDEQFHLTDTFNNVFTVGAYDRINLKVCRSDSPSHIRKKSLICDDLNEPTFCSSVNNKVRPIAAFTENDDTNLELTEEVCCVLKTLDVDKATGPDKILTILLKTCAANIRPSLCELFNKSLSCGKLPLEWKLSNISPMPKKSPFHEVCNYRPISLLSLVSKVFEHCIYNRIIGHLSSQLYDLQYGFQSGKSTTAQMLYVVHEIRNVLEKRGQVDTIYLDFAKAFDKVSHDLFLMKLHNFGIRGNLLRWFGDYLSGRLQKSLFLV
ncbi:Hypothetical predicted protein, partial [Paramuricea clavata]